MAWAFTHSHFNNGIAHLANAHARLAAVRAETWRPHFTNVLLHTVGVLLLFLVVAQMTGALWRSAFVGQSLRFIPARGISRMDFA